MPTVYVTQEPQRRDPNTGKLYPGMNLTAAEKWGTVKVLFPWPTPYRETDYVVAELRKDLAAYDLANGDVLLAIGDPSIWTSAIGVLATMKGKFRTLRWDRNRSEYSALEFRF